jgi:hypothetical protein
MQFQQPQKSSDRAERADLPRLSMPVSALVEAEQKFVRDVVRLPLRRQREGEQVKAYFPTCLRTMPSFSYAFDGFSSARRLMAPEDQCTAERSLMAENAELAAHYAGERPADGSLAPRGVCVSIVVPGDLSGARLSFCLFDAAALLSDKKTSDGLPVTLQARFSAYAGEAALPMQRFAAKEAWTSRTTVEGAALLALRWPQAGPGGECVVRVEFEELADAHSLKGEEAASYLQKKLLGLALRHGVRLPGALYSSTGATPPAFAEKQIAASCEEFRNLVEKTVPFDYTPMMLEKMERDGRTEPDALSEVSGVYLRLVPHGQGAAGLASPEAMHAMLLAGVDSEAEAAQLVRRNTRGGVLAPPDEETAKRLLLHTVATQVEPLCLAGMVSLYGALGKPGAPIRSPGTLVRALATRIVELGNVCSVFELHVCTLEALFPVEANLISLEEEHIRRCVAYCNHAFRGGAKPVFFRQPPRLPAAEPPAEQRSAADSFLISGLGVRLDCPKTLLGDALGILREANAPPVVLDLMTCVAAARGCAVSLRDAFAVCLESLRADEAAAQQQRGEVARLKAIADAALAMLTMKRPPPSARHAVEAKKVTVLLRGLCLKAGKRVARFSGVPKSSSVAARSLAQSIYSAYAKADDPETPHVEEAASVLQSRDDIFHAIAAAFRVCMISPGKARDAFILSLDASGMCMRRVLPDGSAEGCSLGDCFEAEDPRIISLKFKQPDAVIATPLVRAA